MSNTSLAQKKLISFLKKRHPSLSNKELSKATSDLNRFVNLVQKIYIEPQAQFKIVDNKRIISTDFEEFKKVLGNEKSMPIEEAFRKFNKSVTKDKYGR